ncbi:MAG TPA: L-2-amino-thiazoline-4-carboxylic acid hydrolase [Desulfobaccales bacterium]|nr:L-2-amino-thiazoline-4-carboxylic acid hydrolase [Desulfobaccales bacterium]
MYWKGRISSECQPPFRNLAGLSLFGRREVQAPLAAVLIREFAGALGLDRALEVATAAIQADAALAGRAMAQRYGGYTMLDLARVVKEVWAEDDAITLRLLEESETRLRFDVTRCRYVELYERLGMKELGYCLSCSRDEAFARGFNPRLRLARSQTIMQGAPFCDFHFTLA